MRFDNFFTKKCPFGHFFIFLSPASNLLYQLPVNQRVNPTYGVAPCATIGNNNADKNGIKHNFIVFPFVCLYWTKLLYCTKKTYARFYTLDKTNILCDIMLYNEQFKHDTFIKRR